MEKKVVIIGNPDDAIYKAKKLVKESHFFDRMETIRYRPVKDMVVYPALLEADCKVLYLNGEIDDNWIIEIHIPDEDTLYEKPSTLWTR